MLDLQKKTLLVIAPHPDDEVIGSAGLIQKIKKSGGKAYVLFLTVAASQDFSERGYSTSEERLEEIKKVAEKLSLDSWKVAFPGEEYHLKLDQVPQKTLIEAIERGDEVSLEAIKPDIIVLPAFDDYNQDHRAAAAAAFAACRPAPASEKFVPPLILASEAPMGAWSHAAGLGQANTFIELTEEEVGVKMAAMDLYTTQVRQPFHPRHSETLRTLAALRGSTIGCHYAEAFNCLKIQI